MANFFSHSPVIFRAVGNNKIRTRKVWDRECAGSMFLAKCRVLICYAYEAVCLLLSESASCDYFALGFTIISQLKTVPSPPAVSCVM